MSFPFVKFNNGQQFPAIGLGTWGSRKNIVRDAVKFAIDIGYRHIDTARVYLNEQEIGLAVEEKLKAGLIKREDIYITSKVWNTYHKKDNVLPALQRSLKDLKLNYLDLYLIHWPMAYKDGDDLFPQDKNKKNLYSDAKFIDVWKVMEKCVKDGLVKSIGLANFNSKQIDTILKEAQIKPVVNQVECHPYFTQTKLHDFCKSKSIILTAYSPLGSPARPWVKPGEPVLLEDKKLKEIAKKYKKSVGQILIRYQIERGHIVIPKSANKERIKSNFDVFTFKLSPQDMKEINGLNRNLRFVGLPEDKNHKDYPFNEEF